MPENHSYIAPRRPTVNICAMKINETISRVRVSVSIVLCNSPLPVVLRTLHSLMHAVERAAAAGNVDPVSVYLVDNASEAAFRSELESALISFPQSEFFHVYYCPQTSNRGFGSGHNVALAMADSDFHLILNPDVELSHEAIDSGLTAMLQGPDIALLSPRVIGGSGQQEFLCKRYPSVFVLLLRGFAPGFLRRVFMTKLAHYEMRDMCSGSAPVAVPIASGCFMLARTAALRAVGGFDEDFFLYFEDFDLSLRIAGQGRVVFDPSVCIVHHGGYAARKGHRHLRYFLRSGIRFFHRHGWRWI
jgi:GT2 family glycosyltransferase